MTEQRSTAAQALPLLEALPAWLARLRRWCSLLLLLAACCMVLVAWVAQDMGLLARPAAAWLGGAVAGMALLAILLDLLIDRLHGRPLEWDIRNGVGQRRGRQHGIPTPLSDIIVPLLAAASDGPG